MFSMKEIPTLILICKKNQEDISTGSSLRYQWLKKGLKIYKQIYREKDRNMLHTDTLHKVCA